MGGCSVIGGEVSSDFVIGGEVSGASEVVVKFRQLWLAVKVGHLCD